MPRIREETKSDVDPSCFLMAHPSEAIISGLPGACGRDRDGPVVLPATGIRSRLAQMITPLLRGDHLCMCEGRSRPHPSGKPLAHRDMPPSEDALGLPPTGAQPVDATPSAAARLPSPRDG